MIRRLLLAVLLLTPPALAQQRYVERIDVEIANIEVVVTDSRGNVVTGLKREDFELFAGGKEQKIVNFHEAARVVLYVDNRTLHAMARKRFVERTRALLAETLSAGDEVMVATFDGALRVRLPFTSDMQGVRAVLDEIANDPGGGNAYRAEPLIVQNDIIGTERGGLDLQLRLARNYAETARRNLQQSAAAMKTVMRMLAGLEGRKAMILASEGLPSIPGSRCSISSPVSTRLRSTSRG